jgi:thymidylate synthase
MPNDIFCFTLIQKTLANSLGVSLGSYVHQVGSMHLYAQNAEKAKLACFDYPDEITKLAMDDTLSDVLCDWVQVESEARQGLPCSVSRLEGLYDVLVGGK